MTENTRKDGGLNQTPSRVARYHSEAAAPQKKEYKKKTPQATEKKPTVAPSARQTLRKKWFKVQHG